ncbi:MAG TPA: hypothetical protein VME44_11110 [Streptosporangiaceae bacterium]|nr:hypothetical protein [Streptosporangiaceae bacterium]
MPRTRKSLVLAGAALALVGAGTATAAAAASAGGAATGALAASKHAVRPLVATSAPGGAPVAALGGAVHRPAASHAPTSHAVASHPALGHPALSHPAVTEPALSHPAVSHPAALTWAKVSAAINQETNPAAARQGRLPAADQLMPVSTSGPQDWMPIDSAQAANAATIVRQALQQRMGVRSAVIAVATAMQESMLQNIDYGTGTALGLFQQQPNDGWGTPAQVTNPVYAARAFLSALQQHQANDPQWARQPLWANAQAVQESAFPTAYAKWEAQAASLVRHFAMREAHAKLIAVNLH